MQAPRDIAELIRQAIELHGRGELMRADALFDEILHLAPRNFNAHYNIGALALQAGRTVRAIELTERALAIDPSVAEAHNNLGIALRRADQAERALAHFEQATALKPDFVAAHNNRGNVLLDLKRFDAALESFDLAVALSPQLADAHNGRGLALLGLHRNDEARASFSRALAVAPEAAAGHYNLGNALMALERPAEAIRSYDAAIERQPNHVDAYHNRGQAFIKLEAWDMALANYDAAISLDPSRPDHHLNRGHALSRLGRTEAALESFEATLALKPGYEEARWNRALTLLALGRYGEGWREYERRWQVESFHRTSSGEVTPALRTRLNAQLTVESLKGRAVLLLAEQGVGDVLMFASVIPDLARDAGSVTLLCERRLQRLMSHSFPDIRLADPRAPDYRAPACEVVMAIGSLARLYRNQPGDFPGRPYLTPARAIEEHWAARLGPRTGRLRVGLSWRGGLARTGRHQRSLALAQMRPLLEMADCEFVSLQYGDVAGEAAALDEGLRRALRVFPKDEIDDFEALAGLIRNLDVVVSVQNTVVHLSGALGAPCLTLIPQKPEWRYGVGSSTMPWYGSVRLFRQSQERDWSQVLGRIAAELAVWRR